MISSSPLVVMSTMTSRSLAARSGPDDQPTIRVFAEVVNDHRVLDGVEHVVVGDAMAASGRTNLHTQAAPIWSSGLCPRPSPRRCVVLGPEVASRPTSAQVGRPVTFGPRLLRSLAATRIAGGRAATCRPGSAESAAPERVRSARGEGRVARTAWSGVCVDGHRSGHGGATSARLAGRG